LQFGEDLAVNLVQLVGSHRPPFALVARSGDSRHILAPASNFITLGRSQRPAS
jgi:hypothetical protein